MDISLDRTAWEAMFDLPDNDGAFAEAQRAYLGALGQKRPAVILAFPPKAAGTFLRAAAIKATGGELLRVVYAQGSRDAQLYLPTLIAYYLGGFCAGPLVSHIHMQAFAPNISVLEAFGIRPVIMIRSIPDMLASYWDMLERSSAQHQGINCTIPADFRDLPADRKADFLVDVVGPWYAGYYATWLDYTRRNAGRVCTLAYSDFVNQPATTLETLLRHAGISRSEAECQAAIDAIWAQRNDHRFNEGVEGRSHQYFSVRHFERLARMLSYYPSTASSRVELLGH
jgi:hypothetical protein